MGYLLCLFLDNDLTFVKKGCSDEMLSSFKAYMKDKDQQNDLFHITGGDIIWDDQMDSVTRDVEFCFRPKDIKYFYSHPDGR